MSSDTGELYVLREGDGEWEQPIPVREVVFERLEAEGGLSPDTLADFSTYVDKAELAAVLDGEGDEQLSFSVEGHTVTVTADGEITVTS